MEGCVTLCHTRISVPFVAMILRLAKYPYAEGSRFLQGQGLRLRWNTRLVCTWTLSHWQHLRAIRVNLGEDGEPIEPAEGEDMEPKLNQNMPE